MVKSIKKQFKILWDSLLWEVVFVLGSSLIGFLVMYVLLLYPDKETVSYFPLGTVLGCLVSAIYCFTMAVGMQTYFNIEISMGCTRKEFFWSYFAVTVIGNIFCILFLMGICTVENTIYAAAYPNLRNEINIIPYLFKFGIPAAAGVSMIGVFCCALLMKFGRKAFWILWFLWMFSFLGLPRIADAVEEAPHSIFGQIGSVAAGIMRSVPGNIWFMVVAMLCLVSFALSFLFIRKQQVM